MLRINKKIAMVGLFVFATGFFAKNYKVLAGLLPDPQIQNKLGLVKTMYFCLDPKIVGANRSANPRTTYPVQADFDALRSMSLSILVSSNFGAAIPSDIPTVNKERATISNSSKKTNVNDFSKAIFDGIGSIVSLVGDHEFVPPVQTDELYNQLNRVVKFVMPFKINMVGKNLDVEADAVVSGVFNANAKKDAADSAKKSLSQKGATGQIATGASSTKFGTANTRSGILLPK